MGRDADIKIRMDAGMRDALERIAASEDLTLSDVVRRALRFYLSNPAVQPFASGAYPMASLAAPPAPPLAPVPRSARRKRGA